MIPTPTHMPQWWKEGNGLSVSFKLNVIYSTLHPIIVLTASIQSMTAFVISENYAICINGSLTTIHEMYRTDSLQFSR